MWEREPTGTIIKRCSRKGCTKAQIMYQEGLNEPEDGTYVTKWKRIMKSIEEYIDSLPNLLGD
jgi:hypothetical protein